MVRRRAERAGQSPYERYRKDVELYISAGGDPQVQRVVEAVSGVARALDHWYDRQMADLGMSRAEWSVMSRLAMAEGGPLTPSVLADVLALAPSSMTYRLDRMVEHGLVARETDESNRARVLVTLTEKGWQTFSRALRESDIMEGRVLAPLSAEQRDELANMLEAVIASLEPHTRSRGDAAP